MWSAVVPVKRLSEAKSRLRGALTGVPHARLALAIAVDTVTAVLACPEVARVFVVTDDASVRAAVAGPRTRVVPDRAGLGLNAAFSRGAQVARRAGARRVVALTGDLPALRATELSDALRAAAVHARCFLPDTEGTGTTLLAVQHGGLEPRFGPDSAERHAGSGAVRLPGDWPSLRRDVDTAQDLDTAATLGLGTRTSEVVAARSA